MSYVKKAVKCPVCLKYRVYVESTGNQIEGVNYKHRKP